MDRTIGFYDSDPEGYARSTLGRDVSHLREAFASLLPDGARVLDLGCGSGRDSKAFIDMGFDVVPIDGSEGMCRVASEFLGVPVRHLLFSDLDYVGEFDGVWANASLLHTHPEEMGHVLRLILRSLRPGGVLFASFKTGKFAGVRDGRWYTDVPPEGLGELAMSSGFCVLDLWTGADVIGTVWTYGLLKRPM